MTQEFWSKLRWKLCLPEYVLRPAQIARRVRRKASAHNGMETVRLPWGLDLQIKLPELISNALWFKGIYDVVASETIWRLIDEGETCLDIGSHIGYMASLMARRSGGAGKVICFEPHPMLFRELTANIESWRRAPNVATIESHNIAVSDTSDPARLKVPSDWDGNRGTASIAKNGDAAHDEIEVMTRLLDELFDGEQRFGVVKIDVEGHEAAVIGGAAKLLQRKAIRDIVFEDTGRYPTPTMQLLESHGYTLFSLAKSFRRPRLCSPDRRGVSPRDDPNYLATLDARRSLERMSRAGWCVLKETD